MAIENLPGFVWLYPHRPNPYGISVNTRIAYNPLSGERLTAREVQTRQHDGIPYEERVPPEERKEYKARVHHESKGDFYRPYRSLASIFKEKRIKDDDVVELGVYGKVGKSRGKRTPEGKSGYFMVSPLIRFSTLKRALLDENLKSGQIIRENLRMFPDVKFYFLYVPKGRNA